jgi:hypothetical protein
VWAGRSLGNIGDPESVAALKILKERKKERDSGTLRD